jgi:hypothetical protein
MNSYPFNDRANGIFAEGFHDRDGAPVRDTFVSQLRAKIVGAAGRNWSRSANAALAANFSSAEMHAIMAAVDQAHVRVDFDMNYYGGDHKGGSNHVYVPEALIDLLDGNLAAAFSKYTRIDAVHMVGDSGHERFDADGEPLTEVSCASERCA